jgi:hypothetical protein
MSFSFESKSHIIDNDTKSFSFDQVTSQQLVSISNTSNILSPDTHFLTRDDNTISDINEESSSYVKLTNRPDVPYLNNGHFKTFLKCNHGNYVQINKNDPSLPLYTSSSQLMYEKWSFDIKVNQENVSTCSLYVEENDTYFEKNQLYVEVVDEQLQLVHTHKNLFKIIPVTYESKNAIIFIDTNTGCIISCNCTNNNYHIFPMWCRKRRDNMLTNSIHPNCLITIEHLTSQDKTNALSLYQEHRLQKLKEIPFLPVGNIDSLSLYCIHGLQIYPSQDSIINPSITSAIQTMDMPPEYLRKCSINIYENNVPTFSYMDGCLISINYNMYDKTLQKNVSYIISNRNERLWIHKEELIHNLKISTADIGTKPIPHMGLKRSLDVTQFTLIPHINTGIMIRASNGHFLACMCPDNKNEIKNDNIDHRVCYGMGLRQLDSMENNINNCIFKIKLHSNLYGSCGYSILEEETKQLEKDFRLINKNDKLTFSNIPSRVNNDNKVYTRDYTVSDYNPLLRERPNYFIEDSKGAKNVIAVLVPCFTESGKDLRRTLLDLEVQQRVLQSSINSDWEINVLILCDGWFKACKSFRQYIKTMFEITPEQSNKLLEWEVDQDSATNVQTMILQRLKPNDDGSCEIVPVNIHSNSNTNVTLKISVAIKLENRRKHNSHQWFFYAFAALYCRSEYMDNKINQFKTFNYLTDCGTRFHPSCLSFLLEYMLSDDDCVAATGRQRVMSKLMQDSSRTTYHQYDNVTHRSNPFSFMSHLKELFSNPTAFLYRSSQCFDYEASISCFNGAFSGLGMLPVIPGPCGLFRQDILLNEGFKNVSIKQQRIQQETLLQVLMKIKKSQVRINDINNRLQKKLWIYIKNRENRLRMQFNSINGYTNNTFVNNQNFSLTKMQTAIQSCLIDFNTICFYSSRLIRKIVDRIQIDTHCRLLSDVVINEVEKTTNQILDYLQRIPEMSILAELHTLQKASIKSLYGQVANSPIYLEIKKEIQDRDLSIVETLGTLYTNLKEKSVLIQEIVIDRLKETTSFSHLAAVFELGNDDTEEIGDNDEVTSDINQEIRKARDPYDMYFQTVNKIPEESGLIESNLLLAEDRALSAAMVMKSGRSSAHTAFVPNAIFYFEAEIEPELFITQRRRWINGTVAGYIWLLQHWRIFDLNFTNFGRLFLITLQVLVYAIVAMSPCLWSLGIHFSIGTIFKDSNEKYNDWLVWGYLFFYLLFVYRHTENRDPKQKLERWMLHVFTLIHFFATIIVGTALINASFDIAHQQGHIFISKDSIVQNNVTIYTPVNESFILNNTQSYKEYQNRSSTLNDTQCYNITSWIIEPTKVSINETLSYSTCSSDLYSVLIDFSYSSLSCWGIVRIIIGTTFLPFILAFLYDIYWYIPCDAGKSSFVNFRMPSSFLMLITGPFFYLFLPTMVGTFAVYAFSRTWDLSWGNKPSESLFSLGSTIDKSQSEKIKRETLQNARFVSYFIACSNIFSFILVVELEMNKYVLGSITVFILIWGIFQMLLSLIWIVYKLLRRCLMVQCCRKSCLPVR